MDKSVIFFFQIVHKALEVILVSHVTLIDLKQVLVIQDYQLAQLRTNQLPPILIPTAFTSSLLIRLELDASWGEGKLGGELESEESRGD